MRILADLEDAEAAIRAAAAAAPHDLRAVPALVRRVTLGARAAEVPRLSGDQPRDCDPRRQRRCRSDRRGLRGSRSDRPSDRASRLTTRLLTKGPQVTVAAPTSRGATTEDAHGAAQTNCLIQPLRSDWTYRGKDGQPFIVRVRGSAVINSGDVLRETAVAGGGVAQGTWWLYREDLGAPRRQGDPRATTRSRAAPVAVLYPHSATPGQAAGLHRFPVAQIDESRLDP